MRECANWANRIPAILWYPCLSWVHRTQCVGAYLRIITLFRHPISGKFDILVPFGTPVDGSYDRLPLIYPIGYTLFYNVSIETIQTWMSMALVITSARTYLFSNRLSLAFCISWHLSCCWSYGDERYLTDHQMHYVRIKISANTKVW